MTIACAGTPAWFNIVCALLAFTTVVMWAASWWRADGTLLTIDR